MDKYKLKNRFNKNKFLTITFSLITSFLFIGIGFAYIQSTLSINGLTEISKIGWDVHFENVKNVYHSAIKDRISKLEEQKQNGTYTESDIQAIQLEISQLKDELERIVTIDQNGKHIDFSIYFDSEQLFLSFEVDIVNSGEIDAKVGDLYVDLNGLEELFDYTIKYNDNSQIHKDDILASGNKTTLKIYIGFKKNIDLTLLPANTDYTFSFDIPYVPHEFNKSDIEILGNKMIAYPDDESSPFVISSSGINYKAISSDTNGKGLYLLTSTKNDENPIYFYRGEVDNNNVLFANNCWQIVRTTETGGTKLIYNGIPDSNGKCVRDSSKNGMDRQLSDTKVFDNNMSSPANAGYMKGNIYNYKTKDMSSTTYQYGNSVTYNEGTYTLTDSKEITWGGDISSSHYTCFSSGTTCSTVYYIYYENGMNVHYIELVNGKMIEDALNDMLIQNNTDSSIKDYIENTWFASNMVEFDDYLEDTVWCSDLSISDYAGWNPNGGKISEPGLLFTPNNKVTMECKNPSDRFTVSSENGNGKNKYKVGMITRYEAEIAGLRSGFTSHPSYLVTGRPYWTISPSNFRGSWARALEIDETGGLYGSAVAASSGIRPMISLKSGVKATSGNGTAENPYVVG